VRDEEITPTPSGGERDRSDHRARQRGRSSTEFDPTRAERDMPAPIRPAITLAVNSVSCDYLVPETISGCVSRFLS